MKVCSGVVCVVHGGLWMRVVPTQRFVHRGLVEVCNPLASMLFCFKWRAVGEVQLASK
jgi:hypothetical protein